MKRAAEFSIAVCIALVATGAAHGATAKKEVKKEVQCLSARGRSSYKIESACRRVTIDDTTRTYRLYKPRTPVPAQTSKNKTSTSKASTANTTAKTSAKSTTQSAIPPPTPLAVLLVLHGGGGSGSTTEQMTIGQFNRIADQRRVIVAYPDGVDRGWNDGRSGLKTATVKEGVDDIGFLRAVVDDIEKQMPIDRTRIYATGISNGGLMSYRLACDAADFVTAVAAVAANLPIDLSRDCRPTRTVPIAVINGTDDPMMPWLGGDIEGSSSKRAVLSAQETFEYWAKHGDCALPNTHMQFRDKTAKGTTVIRHVARDCSDGTEVRLYEIIGGGHTWPSGYQYQGESVVGKTSRELKASTEIWSFLSRYRK